VNLGELRRAIHRRSGIDYEPTALNEVINEAVQHIATEGDWPWLERFAYLVLVPGTATYVMPADWVRTRSLTLDGDEVPFVSVRDIDDTDEETTGFSTSGDSFTLSPVPTTAGTVKMRYIAAENVLTDDSHSPKLPAAYHGAIVNWATAEVKRRKGDLAGARVYDAIYDGWLARVRKGITRATGPRRIRVRPGGAL
jgi:hypothetical protein